MASNNALIHAENCNITLWNLNSSSKELQTAIVNSCGIKESVAEGRFADFAIELFYVDCVEAANQEKALFVDTMHVL